jgi:hypothetical protein
MLDVLSVLDDSGEARLSNCTLQMGEVALEFKNGRSKVAAQHAAEVLRHPHVMIPGYSGPAAPAPPNESAQLPEIANDVRQHPQETEAQRAERMRAAADYLRSQGMDVPEPVVADPEKEALKRRIAELERQAAEGANLTREPTAAGTMDGDGDATSDAATSDQGDGHGKDQSADADAPPTDDEPNLPDGFEAYTADGKSRCWARKGDGSQCSNPAGDDSRACHLKAHQKLVK